jgi:hypothetical protein
MVTNKINISLFLSECLWKFQGKFVGIDINNVRSEDEYIFLEFDCRIPKNQFVKYPTIRNNKLEFYETESNILNVRIGKNNIVDFYYYLKIITLPDGKKSYEYYDQDNENLTEESVFSIKAKNENEIINVIAYLIACSAHSNPEQDPNFNLENNPHLKELTFH